jgi:predicted nucleic acid-binding protein
MRALLDTNIVIHRENKVISNYSIGHLYKWIDKLRIDKIIHPFTIKELEKHRDPNTREVLHVKLNSYETLKTIKVPDEQFLKSLSEFTINDNDVIDNHLLYEVYLKRVDLLITEDKKMHRKATVLGIENRVWTINRFISYATEMNPELVEYKALSVRKEYFGSIDLDSAFFDSFKRDYMEFSDWFNRKCDETAYICTDDQDEILGFLYLKIEGKDESYADIVPVFHPAKRLKVGTFKVESTGFRLGERFIKIIFDNARHYSVDEIYVTLFKDRQELTALYDLLCRWGFIEHGTKKTANGEEVVLTKQLGQYNYEKSVKQNFPNILFDRKKFYLPIEPQYHTTLLPDSKLNTEKPEDFLEKLPHRYALQKVYISFSYKRNMQPGDILLFYRKGDTSPKSYSSVLSTVGVIEEVFYDFATKDEYLACCQNRTVFTSAELDSFWTRKRDQLLVVKFIFIDSLVKRLILKDLWDMGIIDPPGGPRPFDELTDGHFNAILAKSNTDISFCN